MPGTPEGPVLFVGSAAHDTIAVVDAWPGPDDRVVADAVIRSGGGPAATAAVAAARLGVPVELAAAVGDDDEGRRVVEMLDAAGVGTRHVEVRRGERTAQSVAVVSRALDARCLLVRPGPALRRIPGGYDWVHVDHAGYAVASAARPDFGRLSVDDGNPVPELDPTVVDLYVPTLSVLQHRTGTTTAAQALAGARGLGARRTVATRGGAGAVLREGDGASLQVPGLPVEVASTLGAGDVFHGALLAALVLGRPLVEATRTAAVSAALSCRAADGRGAIPDLAEVDAHLPRLGPTGPLEQPVTTP